jgi:hypothetical protein
MLATVRKTAAQIQVVMRIRERLVWVVLDIR